MKRYSKEITFVFILLILTAVAWRDYSLLFQTQTATGIDGYYYVLQVDSLKNTGRLFFPTYTPLFLYFLTAISYIVQDTVTAVKIGALVFHLLLSLSVFSLTHILTKNGWLSVLGLFILNLSGLHLYMITEFLNNLGALTFTIWGLACLAKYLQGYKRCWLILFIGCITFAIFCHRSTLPLLLLIAMTTSLALVIVKEKINSRLRNITLIVGILIFIAPLILSWQSAFDLPQLVNAEFLKIPRMPFSRTTLPECLILTMLSIGSIFLYSTGSVIIKNTTSGISFGGLIILSLLLTLNPFLNHQTGFTGIVGRLGVLAYLQLAIVLPLFLFMLIDCSKKVIAGVLSCVIPLTVWSMFSPLPFALRSEYLHRREELIKGLQKIKNRVPIDSIIMAPHGEQFVVTAVIGVHSQQKLSNGLKDKNIYWLIRKSGYRKENSFFVGIDFDDMQLVEDRSLRYFLTNLSDDDLNLFVRANPYISKSLDEILTNLPK